MSTKVQITGGAFQDIAGNPLASGYLLMTLSQDGQVNSSTQIVAGYEIKVTLDSGGSVDTATTQSVWPNDVISPADTFYNVSAYTAEGQLVWGPNSQQVLSTPSPFDIGVWVPGSVNNFANALVLLSGVTGVLAGSSLASGTSESVSMSLLGSLTGTPVVVSSTAGTLQPVGVIVEASVTSNGTVTVRRSNVTATSKTTVSSAYNIRVIL